MPETYKFRNEQTGRIIVFDWESPGKPKQSDIEAIERKQDRDISGRQALRIVKANKPTVMGRIGQMIPEAAIPHLEMFTPESYAEGARTFGRGLKRVFTGGMEGLPEETEFPRVAGAREVIRGGFGVVGPPLITAGMLAAPVQTAAGLTAIGGLQYGGEKA